MYCIEEDCLKKLSAQWHAKELTLMKSEKRSPSKESSSSNFWMMVFRAAKFESNKARLLLSANKRDLLMRIGSCNVKLGTVQRQVLFKFNNQSSQLTREENGPRDLESARLESEATEKEGSGAEGQLVGVERQISDTARHQSEDKVIKLFKFVKLMIIARIGDFLQISHKLGIR